MAILSPNPQPATAAQLGDDELDEVPRGVEGVVLPQVDAVDADLVDWGPHFVSGLLGPLLTDPDVMLVKAVYDRPMLDADGRVLDRAGRVVVGLYACGNDAASVMRGTYPGPGTTLGPAFVFAWRAALFAARRAASARAHPIEEKP